MLDRLIALAHEVYETVKEQGKAPPVRRPDPQQLNDHPTGWGFSRGSESQDDDEQGK